MREGPGECESPGPRGVAIVDQVLQRRNPTGRRVPIRDGGTARRPGRRLSPLARDCAEQHGTHPGTRIGTPRIDDEFNKNAGSPGRCFPRLLSSAAADQSAATVSSSSAVLRSTTGRYTSPPFARNSALFSAIPASASSSFAA
jgi:hypothetical protein